MLDAVAELTQRIHDEFAYLPGVDLGHHHGRRGAGQRRGRLPGLRPPGHRLPAVARSAARYVSGYLETDPPPGVARLEGADVSHAWASLFVPGAGWVDIDPTNRQLVNDRYLTTAWGRDYSDVPPLKGVIFTEGRTHDLEVVVDVVRVEGR